MSTYLVAFVVGPLELTTRSTRAACRCASSHVPGKGTSPAFALEVGAFALDLFAATTTGSRTRTTRSICVALPDFAPGAMENLGCVTFRESVAAASIPSTATPREQQRRRRRRRARARAHVVRRPRDDALVERHLAERGVRDVHGAPRGRRVPARLGASGTRSRARATAALEVDALATTRADRVRGALAATTPTACSTSLTYQKGGAILRMLEQYLGADGSATASATTCAAQHGNTETTTCGTRSRRPPASRSAGSWTRGSGRAATRSSR